MTRVSFDCDGVLLHKTGVQKYAKELLERGVEVYILTTRWNRTSKICAPVYYRMYKGQSYTQVHRLAYRLGIPIRNCIFTNQEWKGEFLQKYGLNFLWHLDDNCQEEGQFWWGTTALIDVEKGGWKYKCEKLLEDEGRNNNKGHTEW